MPSSWTPEMVCDLHREAFRRPGGFVASPKDVRAALAFDKRFPGVDDPAWTYLLHRCHCEVLGESIEERRRGMGWSRSRFQDGWRAAAAAIANGFSREVSNRAQQLAIDAARGRTGAPSRGRG